MLFLFLFCCTAAWGQSRCLVAGSVYASELGSDSVQPLPSARVTVLLASDSSIVAGVLTGKDGNFAVRFHKEAAKKYLLKASFMGMQSEFRALNDSVKQQAGRIVLRDDEIRLDEVVVSGTLQERVQKGDTTVINADAYKVPEGAYLEALLKRVPGLVYDKQEKKLIFEGQTISEININGEEFFGNNKEMAIENLPAKLVAKLRVYDKRTESEKFTGVDDGQKNYVLDLETKKELNKTWLLSAELGAGNKKKKDAEAQVNYFDKGGDNFSLLFRSTNRHHTTDYKDNLSQNAGVNATKKFKKDIRVSGNVNHNLDRNGNISSFYQEQYLPGGTQYTSSENESRSRSQNFSANFSSDGKIDEQTRFMFHGSLGVSPNRRTSVGRNATFDAMPGEDREHLLDGLASIPDAIKLNTNDSRTLSKGDSRNYQLSGSLMRKLDKEGKTTVNVDAGYSALRGHSDSYSLTNTVYYRLEDALGNDSVLLQNRYMHSPRENTGWRAGVSLSQALSEQVRLQLGYGWNLRREQSHRNTYELSGIVDEVKLGTLPADYQKGYVDSLSTRSGSRTVSHDIRLGVNYQDSIWRLHAGLVIAPQQRSIDRKMGRQAVDTSMNSVDFQPVLWLTWQKKKQELTLNYNGNTRQPSLTDLVPLTDNTNPLYITRGNPGLKRTFGHNLHLNYRQSKLGISANAGANFEQNSITRVTTYNLQTGGSESYPVNINGNWSTNLGVFWWKSFAKKFNASLDFSTNYSHRVSMVNESNQGDPVRSVTRDLGMDTRARLSYNPTWGGLNVSFSWRYSQATNSLNERNNNRTRSYNTEFDGYVDLPFGLQLRTDLHYRLRSGSYIGQEERQEVLWNAGATWRFLKEKQAELSANWVDILGDENSYMQMMGSDSYYELRSREIRGYFLVSFKYNFRLMR